MSFVPVKATMNVSIGLLVRMEYDPQIAFFKDDFALDSHESTSFYVYFWHFDHLYSSVTYTS